MEDNLKKAIEQMKNGEEQGFNEVYSQTYNRVYFRARQIMKKEEDAQDLTQIVFVEAYKSISSLQSSEAIYSWLDGITYRQGMKIFRKQKDVLLTEEAEGLFETLENNDIDTVPELTADQKATSDIIRGILEELPELQKTAVVMFYFDGMKVEQIAEAMECSANTIKSRLNYARKYLKDRVEEKERKEGYRLHVVGFPVLWYAIKTLSDNTTLTVHAAQGVYDGVCTSVGLQAAAVGAGALVGEAVAGTTASTIGASASTVAMAAEGTAKAAGLGMKIASLSTSIKALIIAGAVTVGGTGIAGATYVIKNNEAKEAAKIEMPAPMAEGSLAEDMSGVIRIYKEDDKKQSVYAVKISDTEYCFQEAELKETFTAEERTVFECSLPDNIGFSIIDPETGEVHANLDKKAQAVWTQNVDFPLNTDIVVKIDYFANMEEAEAIREEERVKEAEAESKAAEEAKEAELAAEAASKYELTEAAGKQISALVAAYEIGNVDLTSLTDSDCLFFIRNYIHFVQLDWFSTPQQNDLPFDWLNDNMTQDEIRAFARDAFGYEFADNYSFQENREWGSLGIQDGKLVNTFDEQTLQVTGQAAVTEEGAGAEGEVIVSGSYTSYADDGEATNHSYTIICEPTGNLDVLGGLKIKSFKK